MGDVFRFRRLKWAEPKRLRMTPVSDPAEADPRNPPAMFLSATPGDAAPMRLAPRFASARGEGLSTIPLLLAAFFLSLSVSWLVFSGTAEKLLSPAPATSLARDLKRLPAAAPPQTATLRFGKCRSGADTECVVDGDTFRHQGMIIRIADIDTPETRNYGCAAEKRLGDRATQRLIALISAGPFELGGYPRDEDQYGRKLRIVRRDGQSLGMVLVAEGLAREWDGARHPWC